MRWAMVRHLLRARALVGANWQRFLALRSGPPHHSLGGRVSPFETLALLAPQGEVFIFCPHPEERSQAASRRMGLRRGAGRLAPAARRLPGYVVAALAIVSWHVSPAHAEPPACPAEVVKCCEIGAGTAPPTQLLRLGLQIWPEDVAEAGDRLRELQPAAVRYSGGPSWRRAPRLDRDADYGAVQRYVADAFDRDRDRFHKQAASLGRFFQASAAEVYFAIWEPPLTSGEPETPDKRTLPESAVGVTAMFYVAVLDELRRRGYPMHAVELSNEPDGDWNIRIPPSRYLALVAEVRRQAAAHGVSLPRIAGPAVSSIAALRAYLADPQIGQGLVHAVDTVSVHAWDDRSNRNTLEEARNARRQLDRLGYRKSVAVTEFAITFLDPTDRQRGTGAQLRTPDVISNTPAYMARTMALALDLAAAGYGPILYWEFRDLPWGKSSYGLYDQRGTRRPLLEAWQRLSRAADGVDRVTVLAHAPLAVFGLVRDGKEAGLVMVNPTSRPLGIVFDRGRGERLSTVPDGPQPALAACSGATPGTKSLAPHGAVVLELR